MNHNKSGHEISKQSTTVMPKFIQVYIKYPYIGYLKLWFHSKLKLLALPNLIFVRISLFFYFL